MTQGGAFWRRSEDGGARGTILLIHGLGESGLCWEDLWLRPGLEGWEKLAPDLLGYGKSAWPAAPPGLEDHADWLVEQLLRRGAAPAVVVGHSMGGVVGVMLSERAPGLVRALLNVEGNVSPGDATYSREIAAWERTAFCRGGWSEVLDGVYRDGVEAPSVRGYYASLRFCDPRTLHHNSQELVALSDAEVMARRQGALGVPHGYLLGHPGGAGLRTRALLTAAGVPWQVVEPAGHWPYLDQPEAFTRELAGFLDGLPS